jgi:hypothetical protein
MKTNVRLTVVEACEFIGLLYEIIGLLRIQQQSADTIDHMTRMRHKNDENLCLSV